MIDIRMMSVALALGAALVAGSAHTADWPGWRGPKRDGTSDEKDWFVTWPPEKLWTAQVGIGYASFAVVGDRAYVVGHEKSDGPRGMDTVYCLDAATGEAVWRHRYECLSLTKDRTGEYPGPRVTPLVLDRVVYTVGLEGHLFCLDAATGKVKWYHMLSKYGIEGGKLDYGYCSSPAVHGTTLLVYLNGALMAFDKDTGKPLWRCTGGGGPWNVPAPIVMTAGDRTFAVVGEMALVGVDLADGKVAWEYNLGRNSTITPVVVDDTVFFSTYPNRGHSGLLRIGSGEPELVWQTRKMQVYHLGNPIVVGNHLYGVDAARTEYAYSDDRVSRLKCLDLATGEVAWEEKNMGWAQLVAADGRLLIVREGGDLIVAEADPAAYEELGRASVISGPVWAVPALANGRVYIRNNAGEAVCLRVGAR